MPRSPGDLRPSWGNNVIDRDVKLASLQSPVLQLIVTPNIKLLYLPEEKNAIMTRGSTITRRLVTKIGPLCPSPISGHRDSYGHSSGLTHRH